MKLNIILVLLLSLQINNACTQKSNNTFTITGKISDIPDGTIIKLLDNKGIYTKSNLYDADTVKNGYFTLTDTITVPRKAYIYTSVSDYHSNYLPIWIAPNCKIKITGSGSYLDLWKTKSNYNLQRHQQKYQNVAHDIHHERMLLIKEFRAFANNFQKQANKTRTPEINRQIAYFDNSIDSLTKIINRKTLKYMAKAPINDVWTDKIEHYAQLLPKKNIMPPTKEIEPLYNRLSKEQRISTWGIKTKVMMLIADSVMIKDNSLTKEDTTNQQQ